MAPGRAEIARVVAAWAARHAQIHRVWLFGSVAHGKPGSKDIDLAVELFDAEDSTTQQWIDLAPLWRSELAGRFSRQVDLELMDNQTSLVVTPSVRSDGQLLYERVA